MTYIYGLWDPRTELIFYVGKADNPTDRLQQHLREANYDNRYTNPRMTHRLRSFQREGLVPILTILEEVTEENWQERERWWIAYCRTRGLDLLNLTEGGEGNNNPSKETAQAFL